MLLASQTQVELSDNGWTLAPPGHEYPGDAEVFYVSTSLKQKGGRVRGQ
jgi:hypothetical protein